MGAGSNFAGLAFPFHREKLRSGADTRLVAVEPEACPKLTKGRYAWDYNDISGTTPMTKMYTLGHTFVAPGVHAMACATTVPHRSSAPCTTRG